MRILVAGELNPDAVFVGVRPFPRPGIEVLAEDFSLGLGSSSAICAAGLARLGDQVSFIGKIGQDLMGRFCLEQLQRLGVDSAPVIVDPALKTGLTVAISAGERALVTYSGAISTLTAGDIPLELLRSCRHLHVSSYFLQKALQPGLPGLFATAKGLGLSTSLDPGHDPAEEWRVDAGRLLENVDVFLPNEEELVAITGTKDVEKALRTVENGHTLTVAKLGKRGCAAIVAGELSAFPAIAVEAVDTTGAGDSFNAGFLHARLQGLTPAECLLSGAICGGLSTQAAGGTAGQPDWSAVTALLEEFQGTSQ